MLKKVHAVVARSTCPIESAKNWQVRQTFRSYDVEKVHAAVAQSTFPGQNVESTTCSDRCWMSCQISKKCAPLWRPPFGSEIVQSTTCLDNVWRFKNRFPWQITGSIAQGGGRSFKDRKPIGEVGCRGWWMAERTDWWTDKWLEAAQCICSCNCNCSCDLIVVGVVVVAQWSVV